MLAYVPDERTLKLALDLARGHSLVAVETTSFPLAEWAAVAEATNLLDGMPGGSGLSDDVKADLDHVVFFGGNNAWSGQHERRHARDRLSGHVQAGRLTADRAAPYVMAKGVSGAGAKQLRLLLNGG